jgi:hypothetical protein
MSSCRSVLTVVILGLCSHFAVSAEFEIIVSGNGIVSHNVPVSVPVEAEQANSRFVALSGEGFNIIGQLTKPSVLAEDDEKSELHFVLPVLGADETVTLYGQTIDSDEVSTGFQFHDEAGKYNELKFGDRPVMRYMYEAIDRSSPERIGETYKVFHHVYDPAGSRYVTKGPGGLFPHHRGLFFGFNRISYGDQKADIWHCRNGEQQAHTEFLAEEAGPVLGRQQLAIDWHGQDNNIFAKEKRELTAYNTPGGVMIEFATALTSQVGKVRLDGDPQHAGFQFRGSQDIPDKTKELTYYLRPDGKGEPGKFRNWSAKKDESGQNLNHINLPWLALNFVLDDKHYTCCYIDHPNNPKPARYSERDYGRFGS